MDPLPNLLSRLSTAFLAVVAVAPVSIALAQPPRDPDEREDLRPARSGPLTPEPAPVIGRLRYGDHQADGKRSLGGSGEMIEFDGPEGGGKLTGVRIHGSRYGMPEPPDESFLIYILSEDFAEIVAARMAPYSLFERGDERWVEVTFARPVVAPKHFWVALDFRAQQTKGVYVSYDTSTGGTHSRIGLPGIKPRKVNFGADWMIEAVLEK